MSLVEKAADGIMAGELIVGDDGGTVVAGSAEAFAPSSWVKER
jgi:hypothetical protein